MLRRIKQSSKSRPEYKESLRSGTLLTRQTLQPRIGKRVKDSKEEQRGRLYNKLKKNKQERERRTFKNVQKDLEMLLNLRVYLKRDIRSF
jgi:hypothetical protein